MTVLEAADFSRHQSARPARPGYMTAHPRRRLLLVARRPHYHKASTPHRGYAFLRREG
jgi:hypothetical protein